jgi:hypothetical protein
MPTDVSWRHVLTSRPLEDKLGRIPVVESQHGSTWFPSLRGLTPHEHPMLALLVVAVHF